MLDNVPYYRNVPSGSWKNSIRFILSSNPCFTKVDKNLLAMRDFSGKGSLWSVTPAHRLVLLDALQHQKTGASRLSQWADLSRHEYLQDQREPTVTRPSVSTSNGFRSRSASNLVYNSYPKPTLNPRLVGKVFHSTITSSQLGYFHTLIKSILSPIRIMLFTKRSSKSGQPNITNVSKLSKSSMSLSFQAASNLNNYSGKRGFCLKMRQG